MTAKYLNQAKLTTTFTPSNTAIVASDDGQVVAEKTQGQINAISPPALPLSLANGGTNANLAASNGGIFYSSATAGAILAGTATAGQVLRSGASTTPAWSTATYPASTTINRILYSSAANVVNEITTGNNGALITSAGGVPSISSTLPSAVQGNITATGALASGSLAAGFTAVTVPLGGTGVATTTAYGVLCGGTTATGAFQNAGAGTATQVLTSNGAAALPTWAASASGGGLSLVATNSPSAVNTTTISGLNGTTAYKLVCWLKQNTSAGILRLNFNSDTGNNYDFVGLYVLASGVGQTSANSYAYMPLQNAGDTLAANAQYCSEFLITPDPFNANYVQIQGQRTYQSAAGFLAGLSSDLYKGSATLSSLTVSTSAGTFTGVIKLYQFN